MEQLNRVPTKGDSFVAEFGDHGLRTECVQGILPYSQAMRPSLTANNKLSWKENMEKRKHSR
ncbi:MAG: hypothetical protein ACLT2Q_02390 [Lachnospiraceae bacterium]